MSGQHAKLAPSSAGRWVRCAGSLALEAAYPQAEDTPESMEGTAAHWAASELVEGQVIAVGQVAPNGIVLTEEMIEGAEMYAEAVGTVGGLVVETRVAIPFVHADNWGTPDSWKFDHNATTGRATLEVNDYKFGHGFVEVFENWQLMDYACGILDQLGVDGAADQLIDVVFRLVQPRSYHRDGPVREWRIKASALRPYFNILHAAADQAVAPDAKCKVNVECKHCSGRHACEALSRAAVDAVDVSTRSTPLDLPPAAMGLELRMLKRAARMLDARITGLEGAALATIKGGVSVPFFSIEESVGREAWAKPVAEVLALGEMMALNIAKPPEALTPKQAIKAGLPAEVVRMYSHVPRGALKLIEADGTAARKVFSNGN